MSQSGAPTRRAIRVTAVGNIPPKEGRPVSIGGRDLAIFNLGPSAGLGTGDVFRAIDNRCPHSGGPLCDGIVTGSSVVCPLHAWKINLETGAVERPSQGAGLQVATYPVSVVDGVVVIELEDAKEQAA
jgi:nitrite reductase (NADH) small subunit